MKTPIFNQLVHEYNRAGRWIPYQHTDVSAIPNLKDDIVTVGQYFDLTYIGTQTYRPEAHNA